MAKMVGKSMHAVAEHVLALQTAAQEGAEVRSHRRLGNGLKRRTLQTKPSLHLFLKPPEARRLAKLSTYSARKLSPPKLSTRATPSDFTVFPPLGREQEEESVLLDPLA